MNWIWKVGKYAAYIELTFIENSLEDIEHTFYEQKNDRRVTSDNNANNNYYQDSRQKTNMVGQEN